MTTADVARKYNEMVALRNAKEKARLTQVHSTEGSARDESEPGSSARRPAIDSSSLQDTGNDASLKIWATSSLFRQHVP